jgi:hypothetical protein
MNDCAIAPDKDSLQRQLTELNSRARWYSSQLWQVPFAYLGLSGLTIANAAGKTLLYMPFIFWTCAVFGLLVFIHTVGMRDGERRAVKNLQRTEEALHLSQTAQYKPSYVVPLQIAIILAVLIYAVSGFLAWRDVHGA